MTPITVASHLTPGGKPCSPASHSCRVAASNRTPYAVDHAKIALSPVAAPAGLVFDKTRRRFSWLELIWADGGYNAWQVDAAVAKVPLLPMEIVKRSDDMKGFVVLPRRWVVERIFSWFGFLVRTKPAPRQGLREPCRNPGHLRYPRLQKRRSWRAPVPLPAANSCCGFGEGTFASTHRNGQDAPEADASSILRGAPARSRIGATRPATKGAEMPAGPMNARRYLDSLRDDREVWIDGRRVADVTEEPAFRGMIAELARLYDLQSSPEYRDEMTCLDPDTGQRISVSWLFPRSAEDLKKKRRNSELWNELSWGQLCRSPDMLAPYIISALHLKDEFSAVKHPKCDFGENLENYYRYCKIHDLFLTHALGDPQVGRSQQPQNEQRMAGEDDEVALHVVEETKEG